MGDYWLLIITQKVDKNDPILGFFHKWLEEFAKNCDSVVVICLYRGDYDLPDNVRVLSLGKDQKSGRLAYLYNFFRFIWQERKNYEAVFVHMNIEYVVLGGLMWKLMKKKIGFWYAHKAVSCKLKFSAFLADVIFTASPESFGLLSAKLKVIGHGIDVGRFRPAEKIESGKTETGIILVGRISRIKNQLLAIEAADILINRKKLENIRITFIGSALTDADRAYQARLLETVEKFKINNHVRFIGSVTQEKLPDYYRSADLSLNLCPTGGLDKVVLESMACGVPALAINKTFLEIFGAYKDQLVIGRAEKEEVAEKVQKLLSLKAGDLADMSRNLREIVVKNHSVQDLIKKIIKGYED